MPGEVRDGTLLELPDNAKGLPELTLSESLYEYGNTAATLFGKYTYEKVADATQYPYSTAAFLFSDFGNRIGQGSANFIGPNILITAAHNVYSQKFDQFVRDITVYPALDNGQYSYGAHKVIDHFVMKGFQSNHYPSDKIPLEAFYDDIAVLIIDRPIGNELGTLGISTFGNVDYEVPVHTMGYPAQVSNIAQLYKTSGTIYKSDDNLLYTLNDVLKGNSGGAIYNDNNQVIGVVTGENQQFNIGTKVSPEKLAAIVKYVGNQLIGWRKIGSDWQYYHTNGKFHTGWFFDQSVQKYYYFNNVGSMLTGWIKPDHRWFYLNGGGDMAVGWKQINGKWFFLKESGEMATGWIKPDGKYYYLKENGEMAIGWIQPNAYWYYLRENGEMATGWLEEGGRTFYLSESGAMLTGTHVIDGVTYTFDIYGALQK